METKVLRFAGGSYQVETLEDLGALLGEIQGKPAPLRVQTR